jgi:EAL domain-containing protein (putative c-di-GMP-specific phosphodiesterase class I)
MAFQPIVNILTGRVVGMEALARFDAEPRRGPDTWFAAAHAAGLGVPLELAAVRAGLARLEDLPEPLYLSVNASPLTTTSDGLAELLNAETRCRIVLELTEHAAVKDYQRLNEALDSLRAHGLRVAIDDVGAGFASMRHLLELAPDFVKIDRVLCRHLRSAPGRALVAGILSFASETGSTVVAEGIETHRELEGALRTGIRYGQGYLFGRPEALIHRT